MQSLLLQDFITIRVGTGQGVVQSPSSWLDLGNLEDVVVFTDVREASANAPLMTIETAAAAQESAFLPLVTQFTLAPGVRTDVVTSYLAKIPAARFLRWHVSPSPFGGGDTTFRIWVAAYGWT